MHALGYETTLKYLAAMTELVLEKTGMLPHSNPGVMGADDLRRLRESNVSVGIDAGDHEPSARTARRRALESS